MNNYDRNKQLEKARCQVCCISFISILSVALITLSIGLIVLTYYEKADYDANFKYETFKGWVVSYDSYYNPTDGYYHLNLNAEKVNGINCTYYDYYIGSESIMDIVIGENMDKKIKWSINEDYGNCVEYQNKQSRTAAIVATIVMCFVFVMLFLMMRGLLENIVSNRDLKANVSERLSDILRPSVLVSLTIIIISGGLILDQYIYLSRNKVNWHFKNFEGEIVSYNINFINGNSMYHLDMIGYNKQSYCTYYNYYTGSFNSTQTVGNDALHSPIKWSQISGTETCVNYKDYGGEYAHFGINMCILLFCGVWFYITMLVWKIGCIIDEEIVMKSKKEKEEEEEALKRKESVLNVTTGIEKNV